MELTLGVFSTGDKLRRGRGGGCLRRRHGNKENKMAVEKDGGRYIDQLTHRARHLPDVLLKLVPEERQEETLPLSQQLHRTCWFSWFNLKYGSS